MMVRAASRADNCPRRRTYGQTAVRTCFLYSICPPLGLVGTAFSNALVATMPVKGWSLFLREQSSSIRPPQQRGREQAGAEHQVDVAERAT
ncbi:hypothetical protein OKW49_007434 [Paraburkholderia youngii]